MATEAVNTLLDPHGRHIRKLRVSLIDRCNFHCFYCMPENAQFMKRSELLTAEELFSITGHLVEKGIQQVRLTGGEPTMHPEFVEIMKLFSQLKVEKLGLTTNGFFLEKHLHLLKESSCEHLNISCDSLQEQKFYSITRSNSYKKVLQAILKAKEMDFQVKVNCVLMKGINDDELIDFVRFSEEEGIEVRFLELMKIGEACNTQDAQFIPASEAIAQIREEVSLNSIKMEHDSTSFNFTTENGGNIGFIASESQPFCDACSRLRLTATGILRACLMSENGLNLRGVAVEDYPEILKNVMAMKPTGRIHHIQEKMYKIGG
jgi:cyclic pyranopterin phosphate synthase